MQFLDLTLSTPEANLACDEALLDFVDTHPNTSLLRLWESSVNFVVAGYSNRISTEVDRMACENLGIPILRRVTGGGAVLQGPGCLNYSIILRISSGMPMDHLRDMSGQVMEKHRQLITRWVGRPVDIEGISDLAIEKKKFSGNAQRLRRSAVLLHGTFLIGMDLDLLGKVLRFPTKVPDYRKGRPHGEFLMNLPGRTEDLKKGLRETWGASEPFDVFDPATLAPLLSRYQDPAWTMRLP